MGELLSTLLGFFILGLMVLSGFSMLSAMFSKKPVRHRRSYRSSNRYYKGRGQGYGYYRTPTISSRTSRPYSGKSYINNPDPNTFMVYFLENQKLGALKLGVGSWGRINEFIYARVSPSHSAENAGWVLLRAAKFSLIESQYDLGREQAYEAERRAHYYWRYVKRHLKFLEQNQMGCSEIEVFRKRQFQPTKGFTETAKLGEVCEISTWNYVLKSPGLKEEYQPENSRQLICLDPDASDLEIPDGYVEAQIKRVRHNLEESSPQQQLDDEERLWSKIEKTETCWNWLAGTSSGYGQAFFNGVVGPAHRIVWTLEVGSDPGQFYMQNNCGKRSCVNPQHWEVSLRRHRDPNEERVSTFNCLTPGCIKSSFNMTKSGLCDSCRQRAKRERRKLRAVFSRSCKACGNIYSFAGITNEHCVKCRRKYSISNLCEKCGNSYGLPGDVSSYEICNLCRKLQE